MPPCPEESALAAYADGSLAPSHATASSITAHLAECARCREAVARARRNAVTSIATRRLSGEWRASAGAEFPAQPAQPDPNDLPRLGDVIADKYRIDGLLGRGGMGVVMS